MAVNPLKSALRVPSLDGAILTQDMDVFDQRVVCGNVVATLSSLSDGLLWKEAMRILSHPRAIGIAIVCLIGLWNGIGQSSEAVVKGTKFTFDSDSSGLIAFCVATVHNPTSVHFSDVFVTSGMDMPRLNAAWAQFLKDTYDARGGCQGSGGDSTIARVRQYRDDLIRGDLDRGLRIVVDGEETMLVPTSRGMSGQSR